LISIAVGGFGSRPAMIKIIHAMPPHKNRAAKACKRYSNLSKLHVIFP